MLRDKFGGCVISRSTMEFSLTERLQDVPNTYTDTLKEGLFINALQLENCFNSVLIISLADSSWNLPRHRSF